jgi:hypothetical protein
MKRVKTFSTVAVVICCIVCTAFGQPDGSTWAKLAIDPLLSAYLTEGCSLNCTIEAEGGKVVINGPFEIRMPDGTRVLAGTFVRDRFAGDLKYYNSDGSILALERYQNGKLSGDRMEWDETGRLRLLTRHDTEGKKTGTEIVWADGVIVAEIDWKQDRPVEKRRFEKGALVERIPGSELIERVRARVRAERDAEQPAEAMPGR